MARLVALLLALLLPAAACTATAQLARAESSRIDSLFAPFDGKGSPGYAVGVVKNGRLVYARGFGRADLENDIPITPQTPFHLASLSKQFTAAAIALLILDGKLSMDTEVAEFFPEIRKYDADLRIKHLIYFTSGLPDYTTLPRSNGAPWFSFYYFNIDDAIAASLSTDRLEFAPGAQWDYSNVNYMLLAKIVERVSGEPLSQFLDRRVFTPLGMRRSLLNDDATAIIPARATGYADRADPKIRQALKEVGVAVGEGPGYVRLARNSPHYGGSGVFSTLEDLARWDANFYSHRLAGPAFTAQILQRMKFAHDKDNDALGLVFGDFHGREMVWFSGGDLDGSTYMARLPQERTSVIVLSNMPTGDAEGYAKRVLNILFDSTGTSALAQPVGH